MIKTLKIKDHLDIRLDKFLKIQYTSLTQSFIEKNIRKKNILINNMKTNSNYIIKKNDFIKILNFHKDKYKNKIIFKRNINIPLNTVKKFKQSIIFQNNDFIILNKWSSISTQGGSKVDFSIDDIIKKISLDYKLVHRLDKDTSGLLIISKNTKSAKIFGELFKLKLIRKTYLAICEGIPVNNESEVDIEIKSKDERITQTKTYYKVLSKSSKISLLLFKPITGKMHQLRIVAKNLTSPIIGDKKYNHQSRFKKEILKLNAHILEFSFKNQNYKFYSQIPVNFTTFMKINRLKFSKNLLRS